MTMSGYRFDEMTASWVVIAASRRGMPVDPGLTRTIDATVEASDSCPFCPGRESETEETIAQSLNAHGEWQVRVVGNRYPSVTRDATLSEPARGGDERASTGRHELVIESREHALDLADFDSSHAALVLRMYRDRFRVLEQTDDIAAVSLFRNRGRRSGSSQSHPHAQLVATTVIPSGFAIRHAAAESFARKHGGALLDALVERERETATRMVESTDDFDAFCPFASHRAYETWIVPRARRSSFADCVDRELDAFATTLTRTLRRVRSVTRNAAYNILVRSPPAREHRPWSRWHIEIVPRTGGDAGFELLSGMDVVPVAPEQAAAELRAAL